MIHLKNNNKNGPDFELQHDDSSNLNKLSLFPYDKPDKKILQLNQFLN